MQVGDLLVEVRDPNFNKVGLITPQDLVGATFVVRFNNVGTWSIRLPYGHPLGELLRLPGYGIVLTGPSNETLISGPTISAKLTQTEDNIEGDWNIEGVSDDVILAERLAYPTPSTADVTLQTSGYDIRTGLSEAVIKGYIDANIGPSAPSERRISNLTVETDLGRGIAVAGTARFTTLQELSYELAQVSGLGYVVSQNGSNLEFSMYEPLDRSDEIRMDLQNRKLSSSVYNYATAKVTRAIVAGRGEAENRIFIERSNADSLAAESSWGRRIEVFKDARQSENIDELNTSGDELLVDLGKTIVEMSVTPSDDQTMVYGVDWGLGDLVTIVANDIESTAVVTEVGIAIGSDGVRVGTTVGTPVGIDFEAKLNAKQQNHENRISNLERATTGYGVNTSYQPGGGTNGTQPVFDPADIVGTFNRIGNLVHFEIAVDFDNITSFGSGRYYLTLPYAARVRYTFSTGHLLDASQSKAYLIVGTVEADSNIMQLFYLGSSGILEDFTSNSPKALDPADSFDISGTYEIEG